MMPVRDGLDRLDQLERLSRILPGSDLETVFLLIPGIPKHKNADKKSGEDDGKNAAHTHVRMLLPIAIQSGSSAAKIGPEFTV